MAGGDSARRGLALIVDEVFLDYPLQRWRLGEELCGGRASGADHSLYRAG